MNEKQVALSESTCSGVYVASAINAGGKALLSIDQLSQIAMERASTAREAITIMGALSEEYGFYGESTSFEGGSESLFVIDPEEAWAFHILADPTGTSSIWAAARVPDDSVAVVANMFSLRPRKFALSERSITRIANMFSIRVMDLSDSANFLGRKDMWEIAEKEGLYTPGSPKDFTATFSDGEYAHKYYSGRRMWGVFRKLAPDADLPAEYENLKESAPYPFAAKVSSLVSAQDVMMVMREWYNGTQYSTGEGSGVAGGAFATPDRYSNNNADYSVTGNWERTIALYRSSDSYVVQARSWLPDALGGVIWFGPAAAHSTVYVPVLAGMQRAPDTLQWGWQGVYNISTSYWANRRVLNLAQIKFSYMLPHIRAVQDALESASVALITDFVKDFPAGSPSALSALLDATQLRTIQNTFDANAWAATKEMNELFDYLLFTYADGYNNYWDEGGFHAASLGYPVWWMEAGNYKDGPPPVAMTALQIKLQEEKKKNAELLKEQKKEPVDVKETLLVRRVAAAMASDMLAPVSTPAGTQSRQLRDCLQRCDNEAQDALYRKCSQLCLASHTV